MNACIGRDFAGEMAKSQARLDFRASYDAAFELSGALDDDLVYVGGSNKYIYSHFMVEITIRSKEYQ